MATQMLDRELVTIAVALAHGNHVDEWEIKSALRDAGCSRQELDEWVRRLQTRNEPENRLTAQTMPPWGALMGLGGLIFAVCFAILWGADLCSAAQQWMWYSKLLGGSGILVLAGVVIRWTPELASDIFGLAALLVAGVMGPVLIIWGFIQACL